MYIAYTFEPLLSGHILSGQPLLSGQLSKSQYWYNAVNKTSIKVTEHSRFLTVVSASTALETGVYAYPDIY